MDASAPTAALDGAGHASPIELSLDEMRRWGTTLGESLQPPRVIALRGDLGAGKTTLVQAICRGYGVTTAVTSPTFALVHEYAGTRSPVVHFDLYRLRDSRDLLQIGWDELIESHALVLIEWPERAEAALPTPRMEIRLEHVTRDGRVPRDDVRRLTIL